MPCNANDRDGRMFTFFTAVVVHVLERCPSCRSWYRSNYRAVQLCLQLIAGFPVTTYSGAASPLESRRAYAELGTMKQFSLLLIVEPSSLERSVLGSWHRPPWSSPCHSHYCSSGTPSSWHSDAIRTLRGSCHGVSIKQRPGVSVYKALLWQRHRAWVEASTVRSLGEHQPWETVWTVGNGCANRALDVRIYQFDSLARFTSDAFPKCKNVKWMNSPPVGLSAVIIWWSGLRRWFRNWLQNHTGFHSSRRCREFSSQGGPSKEGRQWRLDQ